MQNLLIDKEPAQNITEQALAYMSNKYSEVFEYLAPFGNSLTGDHQLQVKSVQFPDHPINVFVENYRRDDRVFLDNYVAVKYRIETLAFLQKCADQVFAESRIHYRVSTQPQSAIIKSDAAFIDYLGDARTPLNVIFEINGRYLESRAQVDVLANLVITYGTPCYLFMMFLTDEEFAVFDVESLKKKLVLGDYLDLAKVVHVDGDLQIKWSEKD
ncbi:MAG TPA: hypothetical protein GX717_04725 [Clostridiaceae bacterium]|nr:hypothetical protein [Clostridiaceae bacterium]